MNHQSKFLWISASPSLKHFHRRLLNNLSKTVELEFWEYHQTLDEASSPDIAVKLLHEYLVKSDRQVHLIGHGISGAVALAYARMYPAKVASLTLLSVAVQPAIDWQSYYYAQLRSISSSRDCILRAIAINLLPYTCTSNIHSLVDRLARDLIEAPSNHSLFNVDILPEGGVKMPLMICGSQNDPVISAPALAGWANYFKSTDIIRRFVDGGHFFHHFYPDLVGYHIRDFWQKLEPELECHQLISAELN